MQQIGLEVRQSVIAVAVADQGPGSCSGTPATRDSGTVTGIRMDFGGS